LNYQIAAQIWVDLRHRSRKKAPPKRGEQVMLTEDPGPGKVWGRDRHRDVTSGFASASRGESTSRARAQRKSPARGGAVIGTRRRHWIGWEPRG
jgi:hypothetical protein